MSFKPDFPYSTAVELYNPTYTRIKGVTKREYQKVDLIFCKFKTYGGTESEANGILSVIDTANIETWYRPDITSASRIVLGGKAYDVIGEPEDIEQRHQFLKFKVRGVKGGT